MREAFFVPQYQKINDLIEIQKKIVVDSIYGNDLLDIYQIITFIIYLYKHCILIRSDSRRTYDK